MKTFILMTMLVCLITAVFCANNDLVSHHRTKRKVLFTKNSKMFFRVNGKDNVIPWTEIFAHGWAFRVNWDLPESLPKRHKFFKRDIHNDFDDLKMIQGYSCILKYLCDFVNKIKSSNACGVFCEIGGIVSRSQGIDANFFKDIFDKCDYYVENCPYSFQEALYFSNGI